LRTTITIEIGISGSTTNSRAGMPSGTGPIAMSTSPVRSRVSCAT
jgi:hypothetical protein